MTRHPGKSLSALQRLRAQQRQQLQQQVIAQQQHIAQLVSKTGALQQFLLQSPQTNTGGLALCNQDNYHIELRKLLAWQQQQVAQAEQELSRRQAQLVASHRQEQQVTTYLAELNQADQRQQQQQMQKNSDAMAAVRFGIKRD